MARRILAVATLVMLAALLGVMASVFLGAASACAGTRLAGSAAQATTATVPLTALPRSTATTRPAGPAPTAPAASAPWATVTATSTASRVPAVAGSGSAGRGSAPSSAYSAGYQAPARASGSSFHDQTTAPPAPTTATTIAPIGNSLPVAPVTAALRTRGGNAHVNPVFAILSGIGFFVALVIVAVRLFVTRPGGPDRRPDPADDDSAGSDPEPVAAAADHAPASRSS